MASDTACFVIALNTTRSILWSLSARFSFITSSTCHEIASPSRSGSVARISRSAPFRALAMALRRPAALGSTSQIIWKLAFGSTEPFLAGRSRTWPKEARTSYEAPKYLLIVLAFAGDSTMTIFILFQWLTGRSDGRIRKTRAGRFGANMGGETRPVKWTSVEAAESGRGDSHAWRVFLMRCAEWLGARGAASASRGDGSHLGVRRIEQAAVLPMQGELSVPPSGLAVDQDVGQFVRRKRKIL